MENQALLEAPESRGCFDVGLDHFVCDTRAYYNIVISKLCRISAFVTAEEKLKVSGNGAHEEHALMYWEHWSLDCRLCCCV
ncbi:hypothetical protein T10_13634 [Trichinella papuae]|uniref:Uncharacterized protein n=1 Tax=Trichinella papuae TaxID=268474 RepID=A0A0V1MYB2_9BILA|nr:hypothetical protein T10_13634 [Trichinella papuae]